MRWPVENLRSWRERRSRSRRGPNAELQNKIAGAVAYFGPNSQKRRVLRSTLAHHSHAEPPISCRKGIGRALSDAYCESQTRRITDHCAPYQPDHVGRLADVSEDGVCSAHDAPPIFGWSSRGLHQFCVTDAHSSHTFSIRSRRLLHRTLRDPTVCACHIGGTCRMDVCPPLVKQERWGADRRRSPWCTARRLHSLGHSRPHVAAATVTCCSTMAASLWILSPGGNIRRCQGELWAAASWPMATLGCVAAVMLFARKNEILAIL